MRALAHEQLAHPEPPQGWDRLLSQLGAARQLRAAQRGGVSADVADLLDAVRGLQDISDERLRQRARPALAAARFRSLERREVDRIHIALIEAVRRCFGFELHGVQVQAMRALSEDRLVEMATGEGKTVTAAAAAVVQAAWGRGCHVVTVNDYLASRDAEAMAPLLHFFGYRVDRVQAGMSPEARRRAYRADVTYGTQKEMAADFLRDRIAQGPIHSSVAWMTDARAARVLSARVTRGFGAAIIDEADSVLVDEAQTPLLISREREDPGARPVIEAAAELAKAWRRGEEFESHPAERSVRILRKGRLALAETMRATELGSVSVRVAEHRVENALQAMEFFLKDDQYIVQEGKIVIVDEGTGRAMPDRTWRDGIHQAVEAKERLEVSPLTETAARVSFQRYFGRYPRLSGMTGTAWEARYELLEVYRLPVVRVATHQPCRRIDQGLYLFDHADAKWEAVAADVIRVAEEQRPILVGTRSVGDSLIVSRHLEAAGLAHVVLNAHQDHDEAALIAQAGEVGSITVATNMAGRGTDIRLAQESRRRGGLHVVATQLHGSARIDRQLAGRAGRQGDPGSTRCYASLEDDLFQRQATVGECGLLARRVRNGARASKAICWLIARIQQRGERAARNRRRQILRSEEEMGQSLGFCVE